MPVKVMLCQTLYDYMGQSKFLRTRVRACVGSCGMCEVQGVKHADLNTVIFPGA